ncbi:hypothetical protein LJR235_004583 [Pararhizobium sp. LjRoot235]|uniref:hypothetical protein n=1 Tax=Pararhizobium sp. LjRoot235 TaxID=3342291 RepID=UPI003ECDDE8D
MRVVFAGFGAVVCMLVAVTSAHAETTCVPATGTEIEQVRETFKLELFDSDSAKFANVCKRTLRKERKKPIVAYCGLLNAKNRYGAYVGFSEFWSVPQTGGAGFAVEDLGPGFKKLDFGYCLTCMMPEKSTHECLELVPQSVRRSN